MLNTDIKLKPHQEIAFKLGKDTNFALFHDCGTGKTITGLAYFQYFRQLFPNGKLLVVCPPSIIHATWLKEIREKTSWTGGQFPELKRDTPLCNLDICVISFGKLKSKKNYKVIIDFLKQYPVMCFIDESSCIKDAGSQNFKALDTLQPLFKRIFVASGTPAPNDDTEYWTQYHMIQPGILPSNFWAFRNQFFALYKRNKNGEWKQAPPTLSARDAYKYGYKYKMPKDKAALFASLVAPFTHKVTQDEVLDLPPKIWQIRDIELSKEEIDFYKTFVKDKFMEFYDELGQSETSAKNALGRDLRLRQMVGGTVYVTRYDEETENNSTVKEYKVIGNSKFKELEQCLDEIGNKQVVIWAIFQSEATEIAKILKKRKATFTILNGLTKDKEKSKSDFVEKNVQYIIANPRSAAHGLTWVNCSTMIYFSYDFSLEYFIQTQNRIYRHGQTKSTYYIVLRTNTSIEHGIWNVLQGKKQRTEIIEGMISNLTKGIIDEKTRNKPSHTDAPLH